MTSLPTTPSFRLDGKRALVTGAGRGIGLAAAVALAEAGAEVLLAARTVGDVQQAAAAIRDRGLLAQGVALDVADVVRSADFVARAEPFDVLVNNAGLARHQPILEADTASYDAVMSVNARAAYFLCQAAARSLTAAGRPASFINMSSQMGHVGGPGRAAYGASKFAVEGFTRAMAIELGPHGIRVNTICPTFISTPLSEPSLADPAFKEWILSKIKLGRIGLVQDIMGPVVFLASEPSALVTGSSLMVDGGWTAE